MAEKMHNIISQIFEDWFVIKSNVQEQKYDIPRENLISALTTKVVSFVARKQ